MKQKWHSKGYIRSFNYVTTKHSYHSSWFKHKHPIPSTNVYERMNIHQQQIPCVVLNPTWLEACEALEKKLGSFGGAQPLALKAPIGRTKTSPDGMQVVQCTSDFDLGGKFFRLRALYKNFPLKVESLIKKENYNNMCIVV